MKQNKLLGQQQTHTQKKEKQRNEMEKKADQLNKDDPQPLRPPEKYHHAPSIESLTPSSTFKKESNDAAARTKVLGFPPTHKGKWMKGSHDALQEGIVPPEGGTASVSGKPTRFLPKKNLSTTLGRSVA
jgi:hypothetical protein